MPLYEYKCPVCEATVEVLQSHAAPAPVCDCIAKNDPAPNGDGRTEMRRLVAKTSFVLNGGGWYKDGYAKGSGSSGSQA